MTNGGETTFGPPNPIRHSSFYSGIPRLRILHGQAACDRMSEEFVVGRWPRATPRTQNWNDLKAFLCLPVQVQGTRSFRFRGRFGHGPTFFKWGGGLPFDTHEVIAKPASPPPEADALIIGTIRWDLTEAWKKDPVERDERASNEALGQEESLHQPVTASQRHQGRASRRPARDKRRLAAQPPDQRQHRCGHENLAQLHSQIERE